MIRKAGFVAMSLWALGNLSAAEQASHDVAFEFHGAGWVEFGRVEKSTINDISNDYNKNWFQNGGAVLSMKADFEGNWNAGAGIGIVNTHLARGSRGQASLWYPFWAPFVSEARVTYDREALFTGSDRLRVNLGLFDYGYNPDTKNLGSYLLHGYVYPGTLVPGFGSVFGGAARYDIGKFTNDFIVKSETEDRPRYDYSVANIVTFRPSSGFELGAGVNFYRFLPNNSDLTSPGTDCPGVLYPELCFIEDDSSSPPDTVTGSLSGTKLMARFRVDPKLVFGMQGVAGRNWGASDWVVYGEAAVIGVKDYPVHYDDIFRRMPVMLGVNVPVLGYLDYLSVEVEYYASRNSADNLPASYGWWVPAQFDPTDTKRDDWKWSVNAAKGLFGNLELSAQVANDHFRPGGTHNSPAGTQAMTTPKDWYWNFKVAYFF